MTSQLAIDVAVQLEQECADLRRRMAVALKQTTLMQCVCYYAPTMEHYAEPCPRCVITEQLRLPDELTNDVIAQYRAEKADAA